MIKVKCILAIVFSLFVSEKAFNATPLTASLIQNISSWCGQPTGEMTSSVYGGLPPYNYQWSNGSINSSISGLNAGSYSLTVTDAAGTSVTVSGDIDYLSEPAFYCIGVGMSASGLNNGFAVVGLYASAIGNAWYIPPGQVNISLWNVATGLTVETYTETCTYPGCGVIYYTFDSLPPGHYQASVYISGLGCGKNVEFYVKEMPAITPSFSTMLACNNSATGKIIGHLNPNPSFNTLTFASDLAGGFSTPPVFSAYKLIFYNGTTPVKVFNTRDSIFMVDGFTPGNYNYKIFVGDTFEMNQNPYLHDSVLVASGSLIVGNDPNCSYVYGKVFADQNKNCNFNSGDFSLDKVLVEFNPGGYSVTTDASGNYLLPLPLGNYSVTQHTPYLYKQLCPDSATYILNNNVAGSSLLLNIADSVSVVPDLIVGVISNTARPGFDVDYIVSCRNLTPNLVPSQTLTFTADPSLTLVSINDTPVSVISNVYTFNTSQLTAFANREIRFKFNVPATAVLGSQLITMLDVSAAPNEIVLFNNFDTLVQVVSGSYDPNDISVSPIGFTSQGYVTNLQSLSYTINFQNTGTDTAFNVTVVDSLPLSLDKYSLQILGYSHPYSYEFKPGNVVAFHFNNLLLPDSNANEAASHGFIKFRINQQAGNTAGTQIKNSASIYFDYNAPVATNEVLNTIFDCNQMASVSFVDVGICEGESFTGIATTLFPMSVDWLLDGSSVATGNSLSVSNVATGAHVIDVVVQNDNCSTTNHYLVDVYPTPNQPSFNQVQATLTSSQAFAYQWFFSGQPLQGETNQVLNAVVNGFYSVMITDTNGCSAISDSALVTVVGLSSISSNGVTISPNPVKDMLQIQANSDVICTSLQIFDISGKEMQNVNVDSRINQMYLNVQRLPSGLYLMKVNKEHDFSMFKFVKE
jgi:uncharacterized repeat protein (TIGR01451 family)